MNNPLNKTDPSGFFFSKLWKEIKPFIGTIVAIVVTIVCPVCGPIVAGMIGGAVGAAVNGGNILMGAAFGAFSGAAGGIGGIGGFVTRGMIGGMQTAMAGGKFGSGFAAAGIGGMGGGSGWTGFVQSSVLGGVASEITGGKFKNGAATAAFNFVLVSAAQKYRAGGVPQDSCSESCGTQKYFTEEEQKSIKLRINELAKDQLAGSYTSADAAALAIHNNKDLQQYLTEELGIEGWAVIDGTTHSIKEVSTGFNTGNAAGVYDSTYKKGDYIWHSHPSGKNVHGGDLYSAWNEQASGIYASGKYLSYMQSNSQGTGGFFKTTDQMRDYRGKYSLPMKIYLDGRWRNAWSDETKY